MKITPKQYAMLLYEMTKDAEKGALTNAVRAFVELLARNRALPALPRIERMYRDYYNAQENVVDIEVTSAREVPRKAVAEIGTHIKGAVELKVCEDPSVLGGARIRIGDYMIDDTVKARLAQLTHKIAS